MDDAAAQTEPQTNALRRKAAAKPRARDVEALSPARALRLSLARAAGDLWELPLSVTGVRHELIAYEDIPGRFDRDQMMILLDGPEAFRGGVAVDRALLTAVTEVQTLGEVTERPVPERAFTPTDCALFAPLLDAMLERMDVMLARNGAGDEAKWILGYRFGAMIETGRALTLALEGEDFHHLTFDVDVAAGMRRGQMQICLPDMAVAGEEDTAQEAPDGEGAFAHSMANVPARLSATLPRVRLSLAQASALGVGDELTLSPDALGNVSLRGPKGEVVARCRLGKSAANRAVCLGTRAEASADPWDEMGLDDTPVTEAAPFADVFKDTTETAAPPAEPDADLPDLPPLDYAEPEPALATADATGNVNFE